MKQKEARKKVEMSQKGATMELDGRPRKGLEITSLILGQGGDSTELRGEKQWSKQWSMNLH